MKHVNKNSDFMNIYKAVDELKLELESIKKKYSSVLSEIDSSTSSISFNEWDDDIEDELDNFLSKDFKNGYGKISSDLEDGNFVSLYNSVVNLLQELFLCFDTKIKINSYKEQLKNTPEKVIDTEAYNELSIKDPSGGVSADEIPYTNNFVYDEMKNSITELDKKLDEHILKCNNYIDSISSITFTGTFDKVGVDDINGEFSRPDTYYNVIPETLSDDYHPDIIFDYDHGVDSIKNPILKFLKFGNIWSNSNDGLHFVYSEADGCYYEINQNLNNPEVLRYDEIPAGDSPSKYGYRKFSISDMKNWSVIER